MENFIITWLLISISCGLLLQVKVDGEYITGYKRFIIAFIVGFPFAFIVGLFTTMLIPMLIIMVAIIILAKIVQKFA